MNIILIFIPISLSNSYLCLGIESIDEINTAFTGNTKSCEFEKTSTPTEQGETVYEGRAILKVIRAKELEKKDVIGRSDPYVIVTYKGNGFIRKF